MISPAEPVKGGGPSVRRLATLAALVIAGVTVSVIKPWDGLPGAGSPAVPTPPPSPSAVAATTPGPTPTPDPARRFCLAPDGWRITSDEMFDDRTVRTWQSIEAVEASGPTDPTIPVGRIISTRVLAIGWCAPVDGSEPDNAATRVRAWTIDADGSPRRIALWVARGETALGGDYRPTARGQDGARPEWAPGRYVFAVEGPGGGSHWFAIHVIRFDPERSLATPPPDR